MGRQLSLSEHRQSVGESNLLTQSSRGGRTLMDSRQAPLSVSPAVHAAGAHGGHFMSKVPARTTGSSCTCYPGNPCNPKQDGRGARKGKNMTEALLPTPSKTSEHCRNHHARLMASRGHLYLLSGALVPSTNVRLFPETHSHTQGTDRQRMETST